MSSFTTDLILKPLEDGRRWEVVEPFRYWIDELHKGEVITVPSGFITDFASIPRIFWRILPPWGKYGKAAVIHDYLYYEGEKSKSLADTIFKQAMVVLSVKKWKIHVMYRAVKCFGFAAWNGHRKREKGDNDA